MPSRKTPIGKLTSNRTSIFLLCYFLIACNILLKNASFLKKNTLKVGELCRSVFAQAFFGDRDIFQNSLLVGSFLNFFISF
jgi:hypothetical protein